MIDKYFLIKIYNELYIYTYIKGFDNINKDCKNDEEKFYERR